MRPARKSERRLVGVFVLERVFLMSIDAMEDEKEYDIAFTSRMSRGRLVPVSLVLGPKVSLNQLMSHLPP